ncbi:hypothetical protein [Mammaliicoccus sciuri]|uniref:hypothetical protein n=1 Tax=Mammaliicoccus sciuri TaxID=1296 RepID=UPI003F55A410
MNPILNLQKENYSNEIRGAQQDPNMPGGIGGGSGGGGGRGGSISSSLPGPIGGNSSLSIVCR